MESIKNWPGQTLEVYLLLWCNHKAIRLWRIGYIQLEKWQTERVGPSMFARAQLLWRQSKIAICTQR